MKLFRRIIVTVLAARSPVLLVLLPPGTVDARASSRSAASPRNGVGSAVRRVGPASKPVAALLPRGGGDDGDDGGDGKDEKEGKDEKDEKDGKDGKDGKDAGFPGGLFGRRPTRSTKTTKNENVVTDDEGVKERGSFEIKMNTTPEGKSNVEVDVEGAVRGMATDALSRMESLVGDGGGAADKVEVAAAPALSSRFPISPSELPHFLSMSLMMFLFIYVFTTVRDTKDTLVVSNCGAEAIPLLKLCAVTPCAAAFIAAYSKLSDTLGRKTLFRATLAPFFAFYGIFAFVLYPMRDRIHFLPTAAATAAGAGSAGMNLLRYWSFSLFFVVSDLWASAGVPLLFWQCANDVTPMAQAKRFYPLFAVTGNLAPIVSGRVTSFVISRQKTNDDVGFGSTLKTLAVIKAAACLGIVALHRRVYAMAEERELKERTEKSLSTIRGIEQSGRVEITMKFEKPRRKLTLGQSARELMASPELKAMATMVFCYNVCVELTEVLWKAMLRRAYPTKSSYMGYMARFSQTVGVVAFLLQLVASGIIDALGWRRTAMIPPVAMGLLAVAFFAAIMAGEKQVPLAEALLVGTVQNVANKVTKYSLFDPCKEMAYIPMGPEARVKGKAAVDVLGARLGRGMGSATQQLLVFLVGGASGSILNCTPYIGGCYCAAIVVWSRAVSVLGRLFDAPDVSAVPRVDNTQKLEKIGEAITIIKSIEDAKREKNNKKQKNPAKKSDGKSRSMKK